MGRHRKPNEVLELTGAFEKNPSRRRPATPKCEHPLGNPPKYFTNEEKQIWQEIAFMAPHNVLTAADQFLLEIICMLMAKFRSRIPLKSAELNTVITAISKMGFTPSDRSKIMGIDAPKDEKPKNRFTAFAPKLVGDA